ncbi:MAG: hypothetical protein V3T60_10565 [Candidatus Binatia bacterium]
MAIVDHLVSAQELDRLNKAGVRGVRFNMVDDADPQGELPLENLKHLAERIKPLQ